MDNVAFRFEPVYTAFGSYLNWEICEQDGLLNSNIKSFYYIILHLKN